MDGDVEYLYDKRNLPIIIVGFTNIIVIFNLARECLPYLANMHGRQSLNSARRTMITSR
jgi:hypothetical protein